MKAITAWKSSEVEGMNNMLQVYENLFVYIELFLIHFQLNTKHLLRQVSDSRLLIENMPKVGLGGEAMIGHSPAQI